jgi:Cu(I)/Ag(I) efflux system membrane fusion protein
MMTIRKASRRLCAAGAVLGVMAVLGCDRADSTVPPVARGRDSAGMAGMPGMVGMEMPSSPAGTDTAGMDTASVPLDRRTANRLGITFARAAERPLQQEARVVGTLTYAEPRRVYVNARVDGWVERLHANYTGKPVQRGEALLALYSPILVSAQEEYLAARRLGDSALADAARRRLAAWDVPAELIAHLDRTGTAERTVVLRAPVAGEIADKLVTEGQAVRAGDNLFLIADRDELWVDLAVFETDARFLRIGLPVEITVDAFPGQSYRGQVDFIQPVVDSGSRTLTARVAVKNRDGRLRPGMYATARLASATMSRLVVPITAVLPTGTRNLVFMNRGDGRFVPREVAVGLRSDSLVEVVRGLKPGDEVVASATYLLDSEANLAAAMQGLMLQMGMGLGMGGMPKGDGGEMRDMKGMPGMERRPR